jgi:hypothetical protein
VFPWSDYTDETATCYHETVKQIWGFDFEESVVDDLAVGFTYLEAFECG